MFNTVNRLMGAMVNRIRFHREEPTLNLDSLSLQAQRGALCTMYPTHSSKPSDLTEQRLAISAHRGALTIRSHTYTVSLPLGA
ncbi:hypothetical protein [Marinibactrum halimedae]|uniref:hypothetical protein n=1 Tax=Marinibactrum halimedae TaxID=1444977 RepID=UPI001E2D78CD|nr:hypothetical protein [Marinibactrum halimedae]MCD9458186.1 hypothetical protein [Marinibactrum halimedae]